MSSDYKSDVKQIASNRKYIHLGLIITSYSTTENREFKQTTSKVDNATNRER